MLARSIVNASQSRFSDQPLKFHPAAIRPFARANHVIFIGLDTSKLKISVAIADSSTQCRIAPSGLFGLAHRPDGFDQLSDSEMLD
ncbi:hypothetical protein CO652_01890 [Rhizobium sp. H4]|nr:hypothetical protein CO652_01890 [Rhizobium sp. H4]